MWGSSRFVYAMYATTGIFLLIATGLIPESAMGNTMLALTAIAGLFGASKVAEKWKNNND